MIGSAGDQPAEEMGKDRCGAFSVPSPALSRSCEGLSGPQSERPPIAFPQDRRGPAALMTLSSPRGARPSGPVAPRLTAVALALPAALLTLLLLAPGAQAHHMLSLLHLRPTPLSGLISGLLHPVIGPDHLLFLLALSLVGLRQRLGWMLGLLAVGLAGSWAGLLLPGLPGAEKLVAFSLVIVGLVLLDRLPKGLLLPAFGLHGYVLSASVLGWTSLPVASYLLGLAISQSLLLLASLLLLSRLARGFAAGRRRQLAWGLIGLGGLLVLAPVSL